MSESEKVHVRSMIDLAMTACQRCAVQSGQNRDGFAAFTEAFNFLRQCVDERTVDYLARHTEPGGSCECCQGEPGPAEPG